jgi:putative phage-type endonuclease
MKRASKKITYISTKGMTRADWLQYRYTGVGASEIGTLMGLNAYECSTELYYRKIGMIPMNLEQNPAIFWGIELEGKIAENWQYWDGDEESMFHNKEAKKIIRRCRRVNAYIRNSLYPQLFVSLDRVIPANPTLGTATGCLECKCMNGFASKVWEDGIPPMYVTQMQTQMLVTGYQYAELATLVDGRYLSVIPFEANRVIQDAIIAKSEDFWHRVLIGTGLYESVQKAYESGEVDLAHELEAEIDTYAPQPDGTPAYEAFLARRFKGGGGEREGTKEEYMYAVDYVVHTELAKQETAKAMKASNNLKALMGDTEVITFDHFGGEGRITWKPNVNGVRSLRHTLKTPTIHNSHEM